MSGKHEETSFSGVLQFFSATGIFWQILIFFLVEITTGYDPTIVYWEEGNIPSVIMIIGLNLRMCLIPGIILLITTLFYLKYNKVTAEKALENKNKLIEMGL
jgi:hypothetical protein